jgi:hypothetical protein
MNIAVMVLLGVLDAPRWLFVWGFVVSTVVGVSVGFWAANRYEERSIPARTVAKGVVVVVVVGIPLILLDLAVEWAWRSWVPASARRSWASAYPIVLIVLVCLFWLRQRSAPRRLAPGRPTPPADPHFNGRDSCR